MGERAHFPRQETGRILSVSIVELSLQIVFTTDMSENNWRLVTSKSGPSGYRTPLSERDKDSSNCNQGADVVLL